MRLVKFLLIGFLVMSAVTLDACGRRGNLSPPPSDESDRQRQ